MATLGRELLRPRRAKPVRAKLASLTLFRERCAHRRERSTNNNNTRAFLPVPHGLSKIITVIMILFFVKPHTRPRENLTNNIVSKHLLIIYHPIIFAADLVFGISGKTLSTYSTQQIIAAIVRRASRLENIIT